MVAAAAHGRRGGALGPLEFKFPSHLLNDRGGDRSLPFGHGRDQRVLTQQIDDARNPTRMLVQSLDRFRSENRLTVAARNAERLCTSIRVGFLASSICCVSTR